VNHDEIIVRLVKLDRAIKRANRRLASLSPETQGKSAISDSGRTLPSETEDHEDADGHDAFKTLRDCISTAETVRETFESAYDPDGESVMRFPDDFGYDGIEDEGYGDSDPGIPLPEDDSRVHARMGPRIDADDFVGHPNPDHDDPTPLEVLSGFIDDLRKQAKKDLEAGNPKRAEVNLVEAINHAEEREVMHGTPFKDKIDLQETLAIAYQKQKKWAEARKILHGLLQAEGNSASEPPTEKVLQRSRHYLLLATIHHEMYLAHPNHQNPQESADLQSAERFAKLAFNKSYKLRELTTDEEGPNLLDAVQLLIHIHEAQGRTVIADSYHRQFMANRSPTNPLSDELLRSLSLNTSSDFDVIDKDELLISTIKQRDQSQIQSLLSTANVNCRCSKGRTPLMYSVHQSDEVTIRKLLDHGAEINATTASGLTALHQAVAKGDLRMARLLLELDADIEARDRNLATPLLKAVEKNHALLVSYMLGQGADIHVKDKAGWTLLHHATYNGAVDVLKHLLYPSHEIKVNETCPAGKTALHYCAELTLIDPAKILLQHGANVDALDANSRSPLFLAVNKPFNGKREQFVNLLLEFNAQVDPKVLPVRQRDYPALHNHPSMVHNAAFSSPMRRGSSSTIATTGTSQTKGSFLRRFSLINTK
jgi:ankyrin repeat protein